MKSVPPSGHVIYISPYSRFNTTCTSEAPRGRPRGIFSAACSLRRLLRKSAIAYADKGNAPLPLITPSGRHAFIPAASRGVFCKEFSYTQLFNSWEGIITQPISLLPRLAMCMQYAAPLLKQPLIFLRIQYRQQKTMSSDKDGEMFMKLSLRCPVTKGDEMSAHSYPNSPLESEGNVNRFHSWT